MLWILLRKGVSQKMDIKEKITELVEETVKKIKGDSGMLADFKKEPVKVIEKLIGKDLPDEQIEKVVSLVKAKLASDDIAEKAGDVKEALKGIGKLFG